MTSVLPSEKLIRILRDGGIAVIPTDTLYGIVGAALRPKTVARLYCLRKRNLKKPMIVLVSAISDLQKFGIMLSSHNRILITRFWPGKVSIVLPCSLKKFFYLHRGTKSIAFRLPADQNLRRLIKKTGPLVAPSANPEGKPPATTIKEATRYFDKHIELYVDGGRRAGKPSTLISFVGKKPVVIRR